MIANVPDAALGDIAAHVETLRTCGRFIRLSDAKRALELDEATARRLREWLEAALPD